VALDGACRYVNTPQRRGAVGVHVGSSSPYNASFRLAAAEGTSARVRIRALQAALVAAREIVHDEAVPWLRQVVLQTDSHAVEDLLVRRIPRWRGRNFMRGPGLLLRDADVMCLIDALVVKLHERGVTVRVTCVADWVNLLADYRAKQALD
jgi:ribonuclease HI